MFSLSAVREALDNGRDMHPDGIPVLAARVSQEGNEDSYYNTNLWKRTLLDLRGVFLVEYERCGDRSDQPANLIQRAKTCHSARLLGNIGKY
jgi:hypothetical protein